MSDHNLNTWIKITAIIICLLSMSFSQHSYPITFFSDHKLINATLAIISQHFLNGKITQWLTASRGANVSKVSSNSKEITSSQSSAKEVPKVEALIFDVFICTDYGDSIYTIKSISNPHSNTLYFHGFDYTKSN